MTPPELKAGAPFDLAEYLGQQKDRIDTYLDRFLPAEDCPPETIHSAMRYSVFAGGKRIRPILTLSTAEATGGSFGTAIYVACALEMIHTYSLIHDDLPAMDDDDYRRGRPTCHKQFGEGIAILAGDGLLTHAFHLLTQVPLPDEASHRRVLVMERICRAIGTEKGMIGGQVVDLLSQGKDFTEDELDYIHSSKTGALIEASVSCAGILSGVDGAQLERLRLFGSRIGLAFQIVDDVLDIEGTADEVGKTLGKDQAVSKATYPALYGVDQSKKVAVELVEEAMESIDFLGEKAAALRELARFISVRRF